MVPPRSGHAAPLVYARSVSPQEPVRLGEYHLLERLGQGGMAMVYRAERVGEAGFKKKVAIKRMLPGYRRDRSLLERFAAEARTNARLDHPNLVQVVDFGIEPEPYLVMELVDGVTLASLLTRLVEQRQRLEIAAACFIGAEAAQGLDYAHRRRDEQGNPLGIVHRDVSPQNVLLSNEGAVKVSDFGLVKAADNVVQTGSGVPIGKLSYMAPEQANHVPVDARADVFSLGIVVWEMLTMRTLMPPNDPATTTAMLQVCDFPPPSHFNPNVPPALDEVVMRCLAKEPERRTPSAQAFTMQLRAILHELAPGYGRDQLARLVTWVFPEKGWSIDEPHETAAQPSPAERMSMPQIPVSEAMERASSLPAPEPLQPAMGELAAGQLAAGQVGGQVMDPPSMVQPGFERHSLAPPAPLAREETVPDAMPLGRKQRRLLPWILIIAGMGLLGLAMMAVLILVLVFAVRAHAPAPREDRPSAAVQSIAAQSIATGGATLGHTGHDFRLGHPVPEGAKIELLEHDGPPAQRSIAGRDPSAVCVLDGDAR